MNRITPIIIKVTTFFHCFSAFIEGLKKNTQTVVQNYRADRLKEFCMQGLPKTWRELFRGSPSTDLFKAMRPFMLYDSSICQFWVIATSSEGFAALSQQKTLRDVGGQGEKGVDSAA